MPHDYKVREEMLNQQRKALKAYEEAAKKIEDETESQIEAVLFVDQAPREPAGDPQEPPPKTEMDRVWGRGFWCGVAFAIVALTVTGLFGWFVAKGIDKFFWFIGQALGGA